MFFPSYLLSPHGWAFPFILLTLLSSSCLNFVSFFLLKSSLFSYAFNVFLSSAFQKTLCNVPSKLAFHTISMISFHLSRTLFSFSPRTDQWLRTRTFHLRAMEYIYVVSTAFAIPMGLSSSLRKVMRLAHLLLASTVWTLRWAHHTLTWRTSMITSHWIRGYARSDSSNCCPHSNNQPSIKSILVSKLLLSTSRVFWYKRMPRKPSIIKRFVVARKTNRSQS